ncbi:MAG TPA: IclR family transcriptional regulator [Alphaproteobacteria bacterium]|nr:IclR family transcriptional regulator [Alphaproteobacteria bacterium]
MKPATAATTKPRAARGRAGASKPKGQAAAVVSVPGLAGVEELATDRQFSTNLARGLEVLRAFTPTEPILGNREISLRTGLPKATVSRLTYTLTLLGYLARVDKYQKYRLGAGVLSLGYPLLASLQVRQLARPFMEQISRETGCTVNLGMRDRLSIVYIDTCRADSANLHQPDIGTTRPLLSTSMGRALLLAAPVAERVAILNRLKIEDPARFEQDRPLLEADEKNLRERGFCHSKGDWRREVHAVSVPIRHRDEGVAMNCTMSAFRLRRNFLENEVAPRLMEAVLRIEQASGFQ